MVSAGQPERSVTLHPIVADNDVLKGIIESMADVKGAGDVGQGHINNVTWNTQLSTFNRKMVGIKIAGFFPEFVDFLLN
jgi:hypothetical protein